MLQAIKERSGISFFWILMALYLLNCSVSVTIPFAETSGRQGGYNNQESIAEFVIETVLGFENAIPENNYTIPGEHTTHAASFAIPDCFVAQIIAVAFPALDQPIKVTGHSGVTGKPAPFAKVPSPPPDGELVALL